MPFDPVTIVFPSYSDPRLNARSDIADLPPTATDAVFLNEAGREGIFAWDSSNRSAQVAADPYQGLNIAPSYDPSGARGAWVRKFSGSADLRWWGIQNGDPSTDNAARILTVAALLTAQVAPMWITNSELSPLTNGGTNLGNPTMRFGTVYANTLNIGSATTLTGAVTLGSANITGTATVGSTFGVTGATTLASTLGVTGATTLASLAVTGAATITGTLVLNGTTTASAFTATTIGASGALTSAATIGFSTGAGGTVTQATSKATGVTLNKSCGAITMNNAALASNATATFTFTNSVIGADDDVRVWVKSGNATVNTYTVRAEGNAVGSRSVIVTNTSGGSLSEALVLGFHVTKAVIA